MTFPSSAPGATSCAATSSWPAGVLEVEAGRHLRAEDKGSLISLGPVVAGDTRPGAAIALTAGAGAAGPDYRALLDYYLGGAADPSRPLADQGRPFKTYEAELLLWLIQRHGYAGAAEDARAYLAALPPSSSASSPARSISPSCAPAGVQRPRQRAPGATCAAARRSRRCSRSRAAMAWRASMTATSRCTAVPACAASSAAISRCSVPAAGRSMAWKARCRPPAPAWSPGRGRDLALRPAQHPAGAEPDHDDVRRRHPGVVCRRRHQRRPGARPRWCTRRRGGSMTRSATWRCRRTRRVRARASRRWRRSRRCRPATWTCMRRWARSMRARRGSGCRATSTSRRCTW